MPSLRSNPRMIPFASLMFTFLCVVAGTCVVSMTATAATNRDDSLPDAIDEPVGYDWAMERRHWAYQPIARPVAPDVLDEAWCRNEIDRFVLAELESKGLAPAPEASRATLVRRLYFDLVGLPPTAEQVREFIDDDSEGAFERLVDELLDSPHYGERWGRHWLDVTRYADSNGLDENTAFGNAWRYRDWVVRSLNDDLPYDQFVMEQLAGDLMNPDDGSDRSVDRLLATGFLSLGPKVLAEPDKEKMQIDIVDEQLDVMGQAFMGQTIGCARCHDHKFDPIPTADYYALAGIFYSTRTMESLNTVARVLERALATPEEVDAVERHVSATASNDEAIDEILEEGSRALRDQWIERTSEIMLVVSRMRDTPRIREAESFDESNLNVDHDRWGSGVGIIHTVNPAELQYAEYVVDVPISGNHQLAVRFASAEERPLRLLVDGDLVTDSFCDFETGSYDVDSMAWDEMELELSAGRHVLRLEREMSYPHLDRFFLIGPAQSERFEDELEKVSLASGLPFALLERWALALEGDSIFTPWRDAVALNAADFPDAAETLMTELQSGYRDDSVPADGVEDRTGVTPDERVILRTIVEGPAPEDLLEFSLRWQTALGDVIDEWERHLARDVVEQRALPDDGRDALRRVFVGDDGIYAVDESSLELFPEVFADRLEALLAERGDLEEKAPSEFSMGIAVEDAEVTDLPVFIRGNHTTKADVVVPRGMLQIVSDTVPVPELEESSSGRLELARWIIDPEHPLTSRVAVNRFWHWHFGRGLAPKPSNFGTRGGEPSHPELLDWLARRFVENGWSVKSMHRLILTSSTWRIGGTDDPESFRLDPQNRLLGRREPRRLEAEPIRDSLLSVTGGLDTEMGGSLLRSGNFAYVTNDQSTSNEGYDSKRRAIYLPLIRNDMYPFFSIFDYPDSSVTMDARPSTMVAQQALFMMNSPLVLAQAEQLAENVMSLDGDDESRIIHLYLTCFARHPEPAQISGALGFLDRIKAEESPARSISWPENSMDSETLDPELHAWRTLCHALLSSNEFIYLD